MPGPETTYASLLSEAAKTVEVNHSPGPEYAASERLFQGIPGIERAPNGRLWAIWYSGGQGESPLNYSLLVTSSDEGKSWSEPVLVIAPPDTVRSCDPNIWLDPNGRLWLFWMQAHTLHDGKWGVWAITTEDPNSERPSWSAPRRLSDGIMLNKPTVLSDGEWLLPISHLASKLIMNEQRMVPPFLRSNIYSLLSEDDIDAIDARVGAHVYVSTDDGKTFASRGAAIVPAESSTHNEHMTLERRDGSLWMLLRTSYGLGESTSTDKGATWSPVVPTDMPHPSSRFFLRRLQSGNVLLVRHAPPETEGKLLRTHLTAFLSEDDGKTWSDGLLLEPRGCSYPDGTQAADGSIQIIYDHDRRAAKMIFMVSFTEEDILAGNEPEPILVNQATGIIPDNENWKKMHEKNNPGETLILTGI